MRSDRDVISADGDGSDRDPVDPTPEREAFLAGVLRCVPGVLDRRCGDADGTAWVMVSSDFAAFRAVEATLRAVLDGVTLRGGWSAANLIWDTYGDEPGRSLAPARGRTA